MRFISFIRSVKWGAVAAIILAGLATYFATTGSFPLTVALGAASITFAVLTERDRA
jgi:hypothetical protein